MRKILVAFDGSAGAELAIKDMTRGGFEDREEAKILSLADVWMPQDNLTPDQLAQHPSFAAAHEHASAACHQAQRTAIEGARLLHQLFPNWTISNHAEAESPAWGIIDEARKWPADLVVIGSHGRGLLQRAFLGSVSTKVAAEAPCSVRVVRPHSAPRASYGKLLIPMDGSKDSRAAVAEAVSRNWPANTLAHLVVVVDDKLRTSLLKDLPGGTPVGSIEDKMREVLEQARGKFAAKGISAEMHLVQGDPKNKILSMAKDLDIDTIFMGARGMEHKQRLHLGTLASAICSRAHCTVEIVRERPQNPLSA